jgi:hypothetical protein
MSNTYRPSDKKCGCGRPLHDIINADGKVLGVTHLGDGDEEYHYGNLSSVIAGDLAERFSTYSFCELSGKLKECSSKDELRALIFLVRDERIFYTSEELQFINNLIDANKIIYF